MMPRHVFMPLGRIFEPLATKIAGVRLLARVSVQVAAFKDREMSVLCRARTRQRHNAPATLLRWVKVFPHQVHMKRLIFLQCHEKPTSAREPKEIGRKVTYRWVASIWRLTRCFFEEYSQIAVSPFFLVSQVQHHGALEPSFVFSTCFSHSFAS